MRNHIFVLSIGKLHLATVFHTTIGAMATRLDLVIPGISGKQGGSVVLKIRTELNRLENLLNPYHSESIISRVNRFAYYHEVEIGSELIHLLRQCIQYVQLSKGLFDISMLQTKQILKEHGCYDDVDFMHRQASTITSIILNEEKNTVRFLAPDVQIDTGAFGKGYALDRIRTILLEEGLSNAFVSFGESSLLGMGRHPSGNAWQIRLNVPGKDEKCEISSTQEQNVHIINPKTRKAVNTFGMVAVVAKSGLEAEALSTALFLADPDDYQSIMRSFNGSLAYRLMSDKTGNIIRYS